MPVSQDQAGISCLWREKQGEVIARRSKMMTMGDLSKKLSVSESGFWHWGPETRMDLVANN